MGWLVWAALSVLCVVASYTVAAAVYPDRTSLDRGIVTILVSNALILCAMQVCGIPGYLSPLPLALVSVVSFGATLACALRVIDRNAVVALFRSDMRARPLRPRRLAAERDQCRHTRACRRWRRSWLIIGMFTAAMVVPAAWYPRFTIAAGSAALTAKLPWPMR